MSQMALAKAAGVSQPVIVKLENGEQSSTKKLAELARALSVRVSDLDPAYGEPGFTPRPPMPAAPTPSYQPMPNKEMRELAHALWFANLARGKSDEEIERMKALVEAAFKG